MNGYMIAAHTDLGNKKATNQDSLFIKVANSKTGSILMAAICDGMGGLKKGELASAEVLRELGSWFVEELPKITGEQIAFDKVRSQWEKVVQRMNLKIANYGARNAFSLGTTLTAILMAGGRYLVIQVGDSRAYKITDKIEQITEDQTVVGMEVKKKRLTREEAEKDPRKNILLQCIGASSVLVPEFYEGTISHNEAYLLCSDGFRHKISNDEIFGVLSPRILPDEKTMKNCLIDLVELNKERNENDNISALLIKII